MATKCSGPNITSDYSSYFTLTPPMTIALSENSNRANLGLRMCCIYYGSVFSAFWTFNHHTIIPIVGHYCTGVWEPIDRSSISRKFGGAARVQVRHVQRYRRETHNNGPEFPWKHIRELTPSIPPPLSWEQQVNPLCSPTWKYLSFLSLAGTASWNFVESNGLPNPQRCCHNVHSILVE